MSTWRVDKKGAQKEPILHEIVCISCMCVCVFLPV